MKLRILILIIIIIGFFYQTNALDIFDLNSEVIYCNGENECWIEQWANSIKDDLNTNTKDTATVYIQNVILYILTFITIIRVLYIIYAWFMHLTSAWDEEKAGNTKKIIISVFIWILIIWLSYAIVSFFMNILAAWTRQVNP